MDRREWLAATAVGFAVSVAGCSALLDGEQSPTNGNDGEQSPTNGNDGEQSQTNGDDSERPDITESQRADIVEEIQAVEQSTTEEIEATEASARNKITDIQNETVRTIELLEGNGEKWLQRPNSEDGDVLVDIVEDLVRRIERESEKGRERVQTLTAREQATIEQTKSDGQDEIESITETTLNRMTTTGIETETQRAVDHLETSAQDATQAIETTAVEARTAITETAQTSIANLETRLEERQ